jgi:AcrR family transcriptional regulator
MNMQAGKKARPYRMRQRAASTAATRQRIIDAALDLTLQHWYDEITLKQIATKSGVALQTVVNHFGTKEGIVAAVLEQPVEGRMARAASTPDDIEGAVEILMKDYELAGDAIIRGLALEGRIPALRAFLERGRREHRKWVERAFPGALADLKGPARQRRLDMLVCATDVYTWKLLRRDRRLGEARTKQTLRELVEALHR